jgi:hypothetical protein
MTTIQHNLNLTQLRIIHTCLIFSKPHFQQDCPSLLGDLESALATIDKMIQDDDMDVWKQE